MNQNQRLLLLCLIVVGIYFLTNYLNQNVEGMVAGCAQYETNEACDEAAELGSDCEWKEASENKEAGCQSTIPTDSPSDWEQSKMYWNSSR